MLLFGVARAGGNHFAWPLRQAHRSIARQGEVQQTVLFFSGEHGWTTELEPIAQSLARQGALVAGIDAGAFFRNLEQGRRRVRFARRRPGEPQPFSAGLLSTARLIGRRCWSAPHSGAEFVYAMLAQAPAGTFGGGISLGFCPTPALKKPLCPLPMHRTASRHCSFSLRKARCAVDGAARSARSSAAGPRPQQFLAKVKACGTDHRPGRQLRRRRLPHLGAAIRLARSSDSRRARRRQRVQPRAELQDLPIVEVPAHRQRRHDWRC